MTQEADRLFELSRDLLCTATDDLRFDRLSPSWEPTLGWSRDELRARPFISFCHPDDVESTRTQAAAVFRGVVDAVHFESRYRHRSGHYLPLSWRATHHDGVLYGVARDISALKKQEHALRTATAELEHLAYAVSHDLREPLRAITGHIGLAQDKGAIPAELSPSFAGIEAGAVRMRKMLDGLLEYCRLETRAREPEPLGLHDLVEDIIAGYPELRASVGPLPRIRGDPGQLPRLIDSVVSNAVRFRHPARAPALDITAHAEGDRVVLAFRDNGSGIPAGEEERALLLFARCHPRSQCPEGEGVGLALCKRIAERHGGSIRLVNNADRIGLTVLCELGGA